MIERFLQDRGFTKDREDDVEDSLGRRGLGRFGVVALKKSAGMGDTPQN